MSSRFRADIVGSFLRPPMLLEARRAYNEDLSAVVTTPKPESLIRLENESIRDVVRMQEEAGLEVVTDGEFRRVFYFDSFTARLHGIEMRPDEGVKFVSGFSAPRVFVTDRIRWPEGGVMVEEFRYLASVTHAVPKITLPSPLFSHFDGTGRVSKAAYPDVEQYWVELVDAYHREMNALANAGCRYIQIDETTVIRLCDPSYADILRKRGVDPAAQLEEWASILRKVAEGKPEGVTLAMHICRGNGPRGSYISEGSYEPIARALFAEVPFDTYLLEFDTERAGGFEPLRHVPKGKTVVLGLISTKKPSLENPERLASRVREAEQFVALDDLAISPQCGFSSDVIDRPLGLDDQKRKLDLLVKTARTIWD